MDKRNCKSCGKLFTPKLETQNDCNEQCLANRFDTYVRKTRALARKLAGTMGYRSMSEVRFAALLKRNGLPFKYEMDTLTYEYAPQKYTPDFSIEQGNTKIMLEYKGKLDAITRRKMRAIKKSNPDVDLRIVFEKPNNKLYHGSKMRYFEWAERYGFKWYDYRDVKQIRKDLTEESKLLRKIKAGRKQDAIQN